MVNDYSKLFNENMSSFEARNVFWNAAENLSKTEREKLFETVQQAKDVSFEIKGKQVKMSDLNLNGNYFHSKNPDLAEYVVKVDWIKTVPSSSAVKELGFFGNQNSVCCPTTEKWEFTIERLKKAWKIN